MIYFILSFIGFLARTTPPSISYPIASLIGNAAYFLWPRARRNMTKSCAAVLRQATTSPEARKNARWGLQNYYKSNVDIFRYTNPGRAFFENIDAIGIENLDNALKEGKGAIIVGFHIGNLDLGIRALGYAGYPVNAIVQKLELQDADRFIQKPRSDAGVKLIGETEGVLPAFRALKRNEIVALMIDGKVYEKGILVELGNRKILVPGGVAAMSIRSGASILPCCLIRSTDTRFHGIIGKRVEYELTGDLDRDAFEISRRTVRALEQMARIFPDQWYIFHDLIRD